MNKETGKEKVSVTGKKETERGFYPVFFHPQSPQKWAIFFLLSAKGVE